MTTSPTSLPDFSHFLSLPGNLENEEREWEAKAFYKKNAEALIRLMDETRSTSVLELGCGTGWIPYALDQRTIRLRRTFSLSYVGVDNNVGCLSLALAKNENTPFIKSDLRRLLPNYRAEIVACFAVLKHFGLHEWDSVLKGMLQR